MPDLRTLRDDHLEGFLTAFLFDYSPTAMVDTSDAQPDHRRAWRVFFTTPDARDVARTALAASEWHARVDVGIIDLEDEGWAERSQAELTAIEIGDMIVAPPWDLPSGDAAAGRMLIVIEPSMGFGTGHHQTTRLCLRALQEHGVRGKRVLDLGTGSGVLAIAAAKLGASSVLGVDDDPDAVDAARKNVTLNGLGTGAADGAAEAVRIERADIKTAVTEPAEVVLANLTGALLVRFAEGVMASYGAGRTADSERLHRGRALLGGTRVPGPGSRPRRPRGRLDRPDAPAALTVRVRPPPGAAVCRPAGQAVSFSRIQPRAVPQRGY